VLILPPGHLESVRAGRALSKREKRIVGAGLAAVGALAVALVIAFTTAAPRSAGGCIYVTIPAATGAQQIHECGEQARATCTSARVPGAFTSGAAQTIVAACRKAGLPTGS
jgi:hypothetical protein